MGISKIENKVKQVDNLDNLLIKYPYFKALKVLALFKSYMLDKTIDKKLLNDCLVQGISPEKLYEQLFYKEELKRQKEHKDRTSDEKLRLNISGKIKSEIELSAKKNELNEILEPVTDAIANPVYNKFNNYNTDKEFFIIDPAQKILKKDDFESDLNDIKRIKREKNALLDFDFNIVQNNENIDSDGKSTDDIINRFLSKKDIRIKPVRNDENDNQIEDLSANSAEKSESILSETLAKIFVQQEKFDSAINVYKELSLKYPEKSVYFAKIINDLKKRKI